MSETENEQPTNLHQKRVPIMLLHYAQLLLGAIVLGLDAYSIRHVAYHVLVYSLVVALCNILVCIYLLASQSILPKFYNIYVALGLHLWMLIFWIVDLGLVAYLAKLWAQHRCTYGIGAGYQCTSYGRRDSEILYQRDSASCNMSFGALVASAVLTALEVVFWTITNGILLLDMTKRHSTISHHDKRPHPQVVAPQIEVVRLESSRGTHEQWDTATGASTPRSTAQPILPSPGEAGDSQPSAFSHASFTPEPLSSGSSARVSSYVSSELEDQQRDTDLERHREISASRRGSVLDPAEELPFYIPRRLQSLGELYVINLSDSSLS